MEEFIETQRFYSELFQGYAIMPEDDITNNINELGRKYKNTSWASFKSHLKRMKSALEASNLSEERRSWIVSVLQLQIQEYNYYQDIPERRPYFNEGDRDELIRRRRHLSYGGSFNNEEELWKEKEAKGEVANWEDIPLAIIKDIDTKLKILDDRLVKLANQPSQPAPIVVANNEQQKSLPADTTLSIDDELNSLFCMGFTVNHCDKLMRKVFVGPGYKSPTFLSAKIWALLYVLKEFRLLKCSPAEAAGIAGKKYNYKMAEKPSGARGNDPYQKAFITLSNQVRESIHNQEYGPHSAKFTP